MKKKNIYIYQVLYIILYSEVSQTFERIHLSTEDEFLTKRVMEYKIDPCFQCKIGLEEIYKYRQT